MTILCPNDPPLLKLRRMLLAEANASEQQI
jgi:hypothetical protein